MNLTKNLLTIAIASSLVACGGGGSGSTPSSSGTVDGFVVKGIVVGGKVTAKDANGNIVGTATTGANGDYSIILNPSYTGGPIKIEVEGGDGATMKCDVADGCGDHDNDGGALTPDIVFGQTFDLASTFKLKAVVPNATGAVSTHVTALTDMAAKLAEKNSGVGNPLNAEAISGANSQVAQLFGLGSGDDLIQAKPIDITNPEDIRTASIAELRNALYSAAILGAVLKSDHDQGIDGIAAALETFSTSFADNGGQLYANDGTSTTTTSLKDIHTEADALLKTDTVSGATTSEHDVIKDDTSTAKTEAENEPENVLTESQPSPEAASPDVQQALAMISDLRDLAYALGARQQNTASSQMLELIGNVDGGAEAFANELSIAGDATGPGAQYLIKALGMAASAMAEAGAAYATAVADELTPPGSVIVGGLQVIITPDAVDPLNITLGITQTGLNVDPFYPGTDEINLVNLSLSFSLALTGIQDAIDSLAISYGTDSGGNPTSQETGSATLTLNASLAGTLTGPTAMLSILNTDAKPSRVNVDVQQLAFSDLYTEQALVTVDGNSDDWNTDGTPWWNWSNSVSDPSGDAGDAPGTDITEFLYRSSDLQLAFGIRLTDDPVYPHSDPAVHIDSRYDMGMLLYSDESCGDPLGTVTGTEYFTSARYITREGTTFAEVKTFDTDDVQVGTTTTIPVAATGELIEILVPQSALPVTANSVKAWARVRWFNADRITREDLDTTTRVCIPLRNGSSFVQESFVDTYGIQPSSVTLDLNAKLEQRVVETPAMFEGSVKVALTGLDFDGSESDERLLTQITTDNGTTHTETNSFTLSETLSFTALNMTLQGTFSRDDDSFDALFDATVGGSGFSITEEENDSWSTTYDADGNWLSNSGTGFNPTTTTTGFVTLDAMLKFEAVISGVSNSPVVVQLDLARTTETTGTAGLKITQGSAGKFLELKADLAKATDPSNLDTTANPDDIVPTSATITNQDGITIDILEVDANRGKITKGSGDSLKQLGTVTEESGTVIFRLNDGSTNRIESL